MSACRSRSDAATPKVGVCAPLLALVTWSLPAARTTAQELDTRYYTNIPVGLNLLQFGYARSTRLGSF